MGEAGGGQPRPDGLAERLDPIGDGAQLQPLLGDGVQLALLGGQRGPAAVQLVSLAFQLRQSHHLGQVGVQQPLALALQLAQGLADGRLAGLELLGQPCPTPRPPQGVGDLGRVGQQRAQVAPDQFVQLLGRGVAGVAALARAARSASVRPRHR